MMQGNSHLVFYDEKEEEMPGVSRWTTAPRGDFPSPQKCVKLYLAFATSSSSFSPLSCTMVAEVKLFKRWSFEDVRVNDLALDVR
jgi:hypothetical protein